MTTEAASQAGAGQELTDRSGRTWEYACYQSPSGPAFWLTTPDEFAPGHAANYTVHFDGAIGIVQ